MAQDPYIDDVANSKLAKPKVPSLPAASGVSVDDQRSVLPPRPDMPVDVAGAPRAEPVPFEVFANDPQSMAAYEGAQDEQQPFSNDQQTIGSDEVPPEPVLVNTIKPEPFEFVGPPAEAMEMQRRNQRLSNVYKVALDPEAFRKEKGISERRMQGALNTAFLKSVVGDEISGSPSDMTRKAAIRMVGKKMFPGQNVTDEATLFQAVTGQARKVKDKQDVYKAIETYAAKSATLGEAGALGMGTGIADEWESIKRLPGYDPANAAEFIAARRKIEDQVESIIEPHRKTLDSIFGAFEEAGRGEALDVDMITGMSEEEWGGMLQAASLYARGRKSSNEEGFFEGAGKRVERGVKGAANWFADTMIQTGLKGAEYFRERGVDLPQGGIDERFKDSATFDKYRKRVRDLNRIYTGQFDPIDTEGWAGIVQSIPSVAAQSMLWMTSSPFMLGSLTGASHEQLMDKAVAQGLSEDQAISVANDLQYIHMVPQYAIEKFQIGAATGKIPGFNKFLVKVSNSFDNAFVRATARVAATTAVEASTEVAQDIAAASVEEVASWVREVMPDTNWTEETVDAFKRFPEYAVSMLGLSGLSAVGGAHLDKAAQALKDDFTHQQRVMAGIPSEVSAKIDQSEGLGDLVELYKEGMENRDPSSQEALAELETAKADWEQANAAAEAQRKAGMGLPTFTLGKDNKWSVTDQETGEVLGEGMNLQQAMATAQEVTMLKNDKQGRLTAQLFDMLEATEATSSKDLETVLQPFFDANATTIQKYVQNGEQAMLEQAQLMGVAQGGSVLGVSIPELKSRGRNTVNRIFQGGNVVTIFHEEAHKLYRDALRSGTLTEDGVANSLVALDQQIRNGKKGGEAGLLPDNFAELTGDKRARAVDEGLAALVEIETLRRRKKGGASGKVDGGKFVPGVGVKPGLIARNLSNQGHVINQARQEAKSPLARDMRKLAGFVDVIKSFMGVQLARLMEMKRAIKEGRIDEAQLDALLDKLYGMDGQAEMEAKAKQETKAILETRPERKPKSKRSKPFKFKKTDKTKQQLFEEQPIIEAIQSKGKILTKSSAIKALGRDRAKDNASEWDDAPAYNSVMNVIYGPTGVTPSTMAQALYEDGDLSAPRADVLWAAISEAYSVAEKGGEFAESDLRQAQDEEFLVAIESGGKVMAMSEMLKEGDILVIDGNDVTVTKVTDAGVTIDGGGRFGTQTIKEAEFYVDEIVTDQEQETEAADTPFSIGRATVTPSMDTQVFQGDADSPSVIGPASFSIGAWHGTPHKVDKFTTEKIGTGEGAQAYGYGLYYAGNQEVAEGYRQRLSGGQWQGNDGTVYQPLEIREAVDQKAKELGYGIRDRQDAADAWSSHAKGQDVSHLPAFEAIRQVIDEKGIRIQTSGNLYKVDLKVEDDQLLDWDKPLSQQPKAVQEAWEKMRPKFTQDDADLLDELGVPDDYSDGYVPREPSGAAIYQELSNSYQAGQRGDMTASKDLYDAGIRGIKFLDGNSRNRPLREIKKEFLEALPEDADFEMVEEAIKEGVFSAPQIAVLEAIKNDDWLGFDYPAQAISAATSADMASRYDPSPALVEAVENLRGDVTYNYVIFDEADIEILEENGQPVELSPAFQLAVTPAMDAAYMAAVESGDMDTAQKMVDEAAKKAGYDSGPWYHGTKADDFTAFDPEKAGQNMASNRYGPVGFWFAKSKEKAAGWASGRKLLKDGKPTSGRVITAYLKTGNNLEAENALSGGRDEFAKDDYDSIIRPGIAVVKSPQQIKDASPVTRDDAGNVIPLSERFNEQSADIRYQIGPRAMTEAVTDAVYRLAQKEPAAKQKIIKGILERLGKLRDYVDKRGRAFNFDAFGEEFEGDFTEEKMSLLNAMAIMQGIRGALPMEVRGKLSGDLQLAKYDTDEKRLDYLKRQVKKAERVIDNWLRDEYVQDLEKLVKRAESKRKGGEKSKGSLGGEAHQYFDRIKEAMAMDQKQVDAALAAIEKEIAEEEDADLLDLFEQEEILRTYGNFASNKVGERKTVEEMATAFDRALEVYTVKRNLRKMKEEARLAEVRTLVELTKEALGNLTEADVQKVEAASNGIFNVAKEGVWSVISFVQTLEELFGENHPLVKRWDKMARQSSRQRTKDNIATQKRWVQATKVATGKKGMERRNQLWDMQTKQTITAVIRPTTTQTVKVPIDTFFDAESRKALGLTKDEEAQLTEQFENLPEKRGNLKYLKLERVVEGKPVPVKYTEAEGMFLSMLYAQDEYKKGMTKNGMGEEFQNEIEDGLSDAAKQLRDYLFQEYADNFEPLRALFEDMYGVDLRKTSNYSPGRFYSMGQDRETGPMGEGMDKTGFKAGFIKERKRHTAKAKPQNAIQVYFTHMAQTQHWLHTAKFARELEGVFGNPDVKQSLMGKDQKAARAVPKWIDSIKGNGLQQQQSTKAFQWMMSNMAFIAMSWKVSTAIKNFVGAGLNVTYRLGPKDLVNGYRRLLMGQIDLAPVWNSDVIQNKLLGGYAPEVRAAINRQLGGKPSLREDFLLAGLQIHGELDARASALGGAIAYDAYYRKALANNTPEVAHALAMDQVDDLISRTSQPTEFTDRSLMEQEMGALGKLAFVFGSEARQKSAMWLIAWKNTLTGKPTKRDIQTLVVAHMVVAPIMWAAGAVLRDIMDDDDEDNYFLFLDEKNWNWKSLAIAMATGPVSGIVIIRDIFDGFNGESGPLKMFVDAFDAGKDVFEAAWLDELDDQDAIWMEKKISTIARGLGPSIGTASNIFDQIWETVINFTKD